MSIQYPPSPYVPGCIWEAIGLPSRGARLYELVHQGIPFEMFERKRLLNTSCDVKQAPVHAAPAALQFLLA